MNISKMFSTEERVKILKHIIFEDSSLGVEKIAKKLNLSKGLVSQYLNSLCELGIAYKLKNKFYIKRGAAIVRGLKIFLNLLSIDIGELKKLKGIVGIGLYGSFAQGTNTKNSDIDIWAKVKEYPKEMEIAKTSGIIKRKSGYSVQILVLHPERINSLKNTNSAFYYSLVSGSFLLWGEPIE